LEWESFALLERSVRPGEPLGNGKCSNRQSELVMPHVEGNAKKDYTCAAVALEYNFKTADDMYKGIDLEAAELFINYGLDLYGRDSKSLYNAGVFYARRDEYEQARIYFEEAVAFDPEHRPSLEAIARLEGMGH
jgi:tetratricopeptide (TPR) repeat protein